MQEAGHPLPSRELDHTEQQGPCRNRGFTGKPPAPPLPLAKVLSPGDHKAHSPGAFGPLPTKLSTHRCAHPRFHLPTKTEGEGSCHVLKMGRIHQPTPIPPLSPPTCQSHLGTCCFLGSGGTEVPVQLWGCGGGVSMLLSHSSLGIEGMGSHEGPDLPCHVCLFVCSRWGPLGLPAKSQPGHFSSTHH